MTWAFFFEKKRKRKKTASCPSHDTPCSPLCTLVSHIHRCKTPVDETPPLTPLHQNKIKMKKKQESSMKCGAFGFTTKPPQSPPTPTSGRKQRALALTPPKQPPCLPLQPNSVALGPSHLSLGHPHRSDHLFPIL